MILLNKPYGVICQFSPSGGKPTLADYVDVPGVYPAGRLDTDSEGLVVLTDDGVLQARITEPRHKLEKVYWAQVEGTPTQAALEALQAGVALQDGPALAIRAHIIPEPAIWERHPPIRVRKAIPTAWVELALREGRNRQVRRMTAAVGLPTLRLVRARIGPWSVASLAPGEWLDAPIVPGDETGFRALLGGKSAK